MTRVRIFFQDHFNSFRSILLGFLLLILGGAYLLSLPAASAAGEPTPFLNALFTSTSAACVTGLVVYDTAAHWSLFGKAVILLLIQAGGIGVVTIAMCVLILTGRQIGILQRNTMRESVSGHHLGGILPFTKFILKGTILIELLGAAALFPSFRYMGFRDGFTFAFFHSVSAFCNAGFDLMGMHGAYSSLTFYQADPAVNIIICLLIFTGGIGFLTWEDLLKNKFRLSRLTMQSKVILSSTAVLLFLPFLFFYFVEYRRLDGMERFLMAMFQTVTPRTAGFSTADYSVMSEEGLLITSILMMIGGAPGSTAGGMKVTTIAVLFFSASACMTQKKQVSCFRRRIESDQISTAFTIMFLYVAALLAGTLIVTHAESIPAINAMFECASALGTVGLTTGITPSLSAGSKLLLTLFMYFGRTGGLTIAYASVSAVSRPARKYPAEKISIG